MNIKYLLLTLVLSIILTSCATTGTEGTTTVIADPKENVDFVEAMDSVCDLFKNGGRTYMELAMTPEEKVLYAKYLSGTGHVFYSFVSKTVPTKEQAENALKAYFPTSSANYSKIVIVATSSLDMALSLIKRYAPVKGDAKVYLAYVNYVFAKLATTAFETADEILAE